MTLVTLPPARAAISPKSRSKVRMMRRSAPLTEDRLVREALQALVPQMDRVVAPLTQPGDDALIDAHVGEEAHRGALRLLHLLLREPCGVLDCLLDVLAFEVRVPSENLVERRAVSDLPDDHGHGDPHAANAGAATENGGIEGNPVEHERPRSL
jgi:hypothetical protein